MTFEFNSEKFFSTRTAFCLLWIDPKVFKCTYLAWIGMEQFLVRIFSELPEERRENNELLLGVT